MEVCQRRSCYTAAIRRAGYIIYCNYYLEYLLLLATVLAALVLDRTIGTHSPKPIGGSQPVVPILD
jgi:hypothetical protein